MIEKLRVLQVSTTIHRGGAENHLFDLSGIGFDLSQCRRERRVQAYVLSN